MRLPSLKLIVAATAITLGASACSTIQTSSVETSNAVETIEKAKTQAHSAFEGNIVRVKRPFFVGARVSQQSAQEKIPLHLDQEINFSSNGMQGLPQIVETLSQVTGIPMFLEAVNDDQSGGDASMLPPIPGLEASFAQSSGQSLSYRFNGPLSRLLDDLARRVDLSWRYVSESNRIEFFKYESRVLSLMLPPGKKKVTSSISIGSGSSGDSGSGSSGGGSGSGSSGDTSSGGGTGGSVSVTGNQEIDPWTSVLDGIGVLLESGNSESGSTSNSSDSESDSGSTRVQSDNGFVIANRDLSQVIVVARPRYMERVANYVEQINKRFARNVLIDVRVLEVQVNDNAQAGISANLTRTLTNSGFQIIGANPLSGGSASLPSRLLINAQTASGKTIFEVLAEALSTNGRVSLKNQGQVVAINGQPAPFQQANQVSYLASVQTTLTPDVGSQTSIQPGTVTVGFTANFLPTILADNRVMLQYQINSSSLLGLKTVSSGETSIQVPEIFSQSLQQQAYLKDGQTIVLFAFEQDRAQTGETTGLLTLGRSGARNKVMSVVAIQVKTTAN